MSAKMTAESFPRYPPGDGSVARMRTLLAEKRQALLLLFAFLCALSLSAQDF